MEKKRYTKKYYEKFPKSILCHDLSDKLRKGLEIRKSFQKGLKFQLPDIATNKEIKLTRTETIS